MSKKTDKLSLKNDISMWIKNVKLVFNNLNPRHKKSISIFLCVLALVVLVFSIVNISNQKNNHADITKASTVSFAEGFVSLEKKYLDSSQEVNQITTSQVSTIIVRIKYSNTGVNPVLSSYINDSLPANFSFVSGSLQNCDNGTNSCVTLNNNLFNSNILSVAPEAGFFGNSADNSLANSNLSAGRSGYLEYQMLSSNTDGLYGTDVTLNSSSFSPLIFSATNTIRVLLRVHAVVTFGNGNLKFWKQYLSGIYEKDNISVSPSGTITVRLRYDNTSDTSALNATLKDTLPEGFSYVSGSFKSCLNPSFAEVVCDTENSTNKNSSFNLLTSSSGVSPLVGLYDHSSISTNGGTVSSASSGVLDIGKKRYLQLQTDSLTTQPQSEYTCKLSSDNSSSFSDAGFCTGLDTHKEQMKVDLLGKRYLQLQTDSLTTQPQSEYTCKLSSDNSSSFSDAGFCTGLDTHKEQMKVDLLGKRYLQLQTDSLTTQPQSEYTCKLSSDNSSSFSDAGFCTGLDTHKEQMKVDLLDISRAQGYIEYQMTASALPGLFGTIGTLSIQTNTTLTENMQNTITVASFECQYTNPNDLTRNVTLSDAELRTDQDFSCSYNLKICPIVFSDTNANGVQDLNEPNISGKAINLVGSDGISVLNTISTDQNANNCFEPLLGNTTYFVQDTSPLSNKSTTGGNIQSITTPSSAGEYFINFGYSSGLLRLIVPATASLGSIQTSSKDQQVCNQISNINVIDTRPGGVGWNLTATVDDFQVQNEPNITIPVANRFEKTPSQPEITSGDNQGITQGSRKTVTSTSDPVTILSASPTHGVGDYKENVGICLLVPSLTQSKNFVGIVRYTII